MNTTEWVCLFGAVLAGGLMLGAALVARRAMRDAAWHRYGIRVSWSAEFKPVHDRQAPPAAVAQPVSDAPSGTFTALPAPVAVPDEPDKMPRKAAAQLLGVSDKTLHRHAKAWGIGELPGHGREAWVVASSVHQYLKARDAA